jgi:serine/threonine protein kinase
VRVVDRDANAWFESVAGQTDLLRPAALESRSHSRVTVTPGTRLGPYQIVASLGEGGMGEVYRATDTNLKREVAIKVLPASVAGDTERLARFQREAEILAALNHSNIAHIHRLEKSDGTIALVMELVEGPTLADRVARGPIPLDEAIPIATQIADALEAAHERGIIHRDLKPANIKVRPDGTVKVLDFGLAKGVDGTAASNACVDVADTLDPRDAGRNHSWHGRVHVARAGAGNRLTAALTSGPSAASCSRC